MFFHGSLLAKDVLRKELFYLKEIDKRAKNTVENLPASPQVKFMELEKDTQLLKCFVVLFNSWHCAHCAISRGRLRRFLHSTLLYDLARPYMTRGQVLWQYYKRYTPRKQKRFQLYVLTFRYLHSQWKNLPLLFAESQSWRISEF